MGEILFDRKLLKQNRKRHAAVFGDHNFLYLEVANRIAENVELLNRSFESILEIGTRCQTPKVSDTFYRFCEDTEILDLGEEKFDLIISNLNLHFINEVPQFLMQIKNLLKPNGVFIASFFGEENLRELAHVLHLSEMEVYNGVSPKMPPTIDVKTAAMLLRKAGFVSPISDFEKIEVEYENPLKLLQDLKFMGQGNIMVQRSRRFFSKRFLNKILENYQKLYGNSDGSIKATFEVVTITGWASN